jgi:hypothetical protein
MLLDWHPAVCVKSLNIGNPSKHREVNMGLCLPMFWYIGFRRVVRFLIRQRVPNYVRSPMPYF